jgi:hypothetical protein
VRALPRCVPRCDSHLHWHFRPREKTTAPACVGEKAPETREALANFGIALS